MKLDYQEDRWYHVYLYLMTVTSVLSLVVSFMTEWSTVAVIIAFGLMAIFSTICFFAESAIMGFTAIAGGFFWTAITCYLVVHYVPW